MRKRPVGATCKGAQGSVREKVGPDQWEQQHRVVVERVLGKKLPVKAVVHHVNGNRGDNSNRNLVVCENQGYHFLLELRDRALKACGNPNLRRCYICTEWGDPGAMHRNGIDNCFIHRGCRKKRRRELAIIWRATGRAGCRP